VSAVEFTIPPNLWLTSNRHTVNRGHKAAIVGGIQRLAAAAAKQQGLAPITGLVHVHWEVRYPKGVRLDKGEASNAQPTTKALLDGIVRAGFLADDGPKYVVAETFRRGPNLTERGIHVIRLVLTPQAIPF
jgi:hypothetical protein